MSSTLLRFFKRPQKYFTQTFAVRAIGNSFWNEFGNAMGAFGRLGSVVCFTRALASPCADAVGTTFVPAPQ